MLGLKSMIVGGLIIVTLSAACYGFYQKASRAEQELITEQALRVSVEAALESSNKAILTLNERIKSSQRAAQELTERNLKLTNQYTETKMELEEHIGRLEKAFNKHPQLMEKLVNKSFDDFIDQVSCNSGAIKSCKK